MLTKARSTARVRRVLWLSRGAVIAAAAGLASCGGGAGEPAPAASAVAAVPDAPASAPVITAQPAAQAAIAGEVAAFSVEASGSTPLSYQWRVDGADIAGATGARHAFATAWSQDGRLYSVVVSDAAGRSTASVAARLSVALPAELTGLTGKLAFLRTARGQGAMSGTLYLFDFGSRSLSAISPSWSRVFYPKNPAFSPDGTMLVFAAYIDAAASEEDIFLWRIGSSGAPVNLTPGSGKRNEDPKFSPDGSRIVFKQNGDIALLDPGKPGVVIRLTVGGGVPELSQPYFMPDGARIVFSSMAQPGDASSQVIQVLNIDPAGAASAQRQLGDGPGLEAFYPIAWGAERILFTRWRSASDHADALYSIDLTGSPAQPLGFNQAGCNNADPFPADEQGRLVFHVNDCAGGAGGFDLFIGSVVSGRRYPLALLDPALASGDDELGPAYFIRR